MSFIKQYRLYLVVALPVFFAVILAAIIISREDTNPPLETTQINNTTASFSESSVYTSNTDPTESAQTSWSTSSTIETTSESFAETTSEDSTETEIPIGPLFPVILNEPSYISVNTDSNGKRILSGAIYHPNVSNPSSSAIINTLKINIKTIAEEYYSYTQNDLLNYAKKALEAGDTDLPYTYNANFTVETNSASVLSLLYEIRSFSGGTQEFISDYGYTYSAIDGSLLALSDVFNVDSAKYLPRIHDFIIQECAKSPDNYYPDFAGLIPLISLENKWYFSSTGIAFIYNPYEIAQHIIITFTLPYADISDIMKINPLYME